MNSLWQIIVTYLNNNIQKQFQIANVGDTRFMNTVKIFYPQIVKSKRDFLFFCDFTYYINYNYF